MKSVTLGFRCDPSFKETIEQRIKEYALSDTCPDLSTYIKYCIQKEIAASRNECVLAQEPVQILQEEILKFSMPDQLGTVMSLQGDTYELHTPGERLTDSFLDSLLSHKETEKFSYTFLDENDADGAPIELQFHPESLTVLYHGFSKTYPLSFQKFKDEFLKHVEKYSMQYAAPCNYRAFYFMSFDRMVKQFNKYRPEAEVILKKLQI